MLKSLLINCYSVLIEIALLALFIGALVVGYTVDEVRGAIIGLIAAFLFAVLIVSPFLLIEDIRNRVKRIEEAKAG